MNRTAVTYFTNLIFCLRHEIISCSHYDQMNEQIDQLYFLQDILNLKIKVK